MKQTDKGDRKTGILWSYRLESERMRHGNFDTRHEAIGHAVIIGRIMDEEYEVQWHESMWRERDEPMVCGYCGFETWYMPLVNWTFVADCEASPFCTTHCRARHEYEREREVTV